MTKRVSIIPLIAALGCGVPPSDAQTPQKFSLKDAEAISLKNHPLVQAARLTALAARQVVTEVKSVNYPLSYGSLTVAGAESGSRIAAGALNNPVIYNRYANGVTLTQLITDFGRTRNLVASSSLRARAQDENAQATREDVLLQVDRAYFGALRAQALLTVAMETVKERQLVAAQVIELAKSKLKSELDVSFANVNLS